MTDSTQGFLDRWLHDQNQDFLTGLTERLDLEAGLREVLLSAHDQHLLEGFDNRLDLEAGIAAIIPPPAPFVIEEDPLADADTGLSGLLRWVAMVLAAAPLSTRLELRALFAEALRVAAQRTHALAATCTQPIRMHEHLEVDDAGYLDLPTVKRTGHIRFSRSETNLDADFCEKCDGADASQQDSNDQPEEATERQGNRAELSRITWVERPINRLDTTAIKEVLYRVSHDSLPPETQELVADIDGYISDLLLQADSLAGKPAYTAAEQAARHVVLAEILGDLGAFLSGLEELLNDFVGADLRDIDLGGVSLEGVRWSAVTTQWPDDWREQIERDSVPLGEDVFEIHYGTGAYQDSTA